MSSKAGDTSFKNDVSKKILWRFMPFLFLCYLVSFLDRVNIGFAALTMRQDLGLTAAELGFGVGIFSLGYCLFEIPSNLILHRVGARIWIARIMITWGIVSAATAFVHGATSFYSARVLLGFAEAGFVPGVCYFLTMWFPSVWRAKALAAFLVAVPLASVVGSPISGSLLLLDGVWGVKGWQWLLIVEAIPAVILGILCFFVLVDSPSKATFLTLSERERLDQILAAEHIQLEQRHKYTVAQTLTHPRVLMLAAANFCFIFGLIGTAIWMPQILKGFGLSNLQVGFVNALPNLLAAVAMVLWAHHSDRTGERTWHVASAGLLAALGFAISASVGSPLLSFVALSVAIIGIYSFFGTFWALPPIFLTGRAAAAGIALIIAIGNVGGFAGPFVIGWVRDATGSFTAALLTMAGFLVISSCIVLILGRAVAKSDAEYSNTGATLTSVG